MRGETKLKAIFPSPRNSLDEPTGDFFPEGNFIYNLLWVRSNRGLFSGINGPVYVSKQIGGCLDEAD